LPGHAAPCRAGTIKPVRIRDSLLVLDGRGLVGDNVAMRAEAHRLGQALLDHHRQVTRQMPPGKKVIPARYTIRYGTLCTNAGVPHILRIVGSFLGLLA
jgi:hypothetical protein